MHAPSDASPGSSAEPPPANLRLATWNIHSGAGTDGRTDMNRAISVIQSMQADIVALQEVGWHRPHHARMDQFAFLRDHTEYQLVEGLARDPLRSRFGNALLTTLPVVRSRWVDLKVRGHPPRSAIIVDLEAGGRELRMVATHFGLTPPEREIQASRLVRALADHDMDHLPTAVLGDFNILRESTRASRLLSRQFATCVAAPTYPARRPVFALDRIYLSAPWRVRGAHVFETPLARSASDHLPLIADVTLAANSQEQDQQHLAARSV